MNAERRPAPAPRSVEAQVAKIAGGTVPDGTAAAADDDVLVPLSTRIPKGLRRELRRAAFEHDLDVQETVKIALEEWISRHPY